MTSTTVSKQIRKKQPAVISFCGVIGAGKSTLAKQFVEHLTAQKLHAVYVAEPIDSEFLQLFYSDMPRWAVEFQTAVFVRRVEAVCAAYEASPAADVFVLDRSIFCDRFFFFELINESGWVNAVQASNYRRWWPMWRNVLPFDIQGFVYLRPTLDACMERLRDRARPGEELIPRDYQQRLLNKHDDFFGSNGHVCARDIDSPRPCLRLSDDRNFRDSTEVSVDVCAQVEQWMRAEGLLSE